MITNIRRLTDAALESLHADLIRQDRTANGEDHEVIIAELDQINNEQIRRSSTPAARWYDRDERARTGHHPANFIA